MSPMHSVSQPVHQTAVYSAGQAFTRARDTIAKQANVPIEEQLFWAVYFRPDEPVHIMQVLVHGWYADDSEFYQSGACDMIRREYGFEYRFNFHNPPVIAVVQSNGTVQLIVQVPDDTKPHLAYGS